MQAYNYSIALQHSSNIVVWYVILFEWFMIADITCKIWTIKVLGCSPSEGTDRRSRIRQCRRLPDWLNPTICGTTTIPTSILPPELPSTSPIPPPLLIHPSQNRRHNSINNPLPLSSRATLSNLPFQINRTKIMCHSPGQSSSPVSLLGSSELSSERSLSWLQVSSNYSVVISFLSNQ